MKLWVIAISKGMLLIPNFHSYRRYGKWHEDESFSMNDAYQYIITNDGLWMHNSFFNIKEVEHMKQVHVDFLLFSTIHGWQFPSLGNKGGKNRVHENGREDHTRWANQLCKNMSYETN